MTGPDLDRISTEARNPRTEHLDILPAGEFVALVQREDHAVLAAVEGARDGIAALIEAVAERMGRGGRLVYVGAGTSGRLGVLDAAECVPTFSAAPGQVVGVMAGGPAALLKAVEGAEDDAEGGARDLADLEVGPHDAVIGIAASGRTPYVLGALGFAQRAGAVTGAVVCSDRSPVAAAADIAVELATGPEVLTGSTRLKAGTATKLVLNTLTTGVFVQLGKCYGNLMVDVQASNHKLVERSRRIVAQATGLGLAAARALLEQCGGEVKTAIVSHGLQCSPDGARERLVESRGRVRMALTAL